MIDGKMSVSGFKAPKQRIHLRLRPRLERRRHAPLPPDNKTQRQMAGTPEVLRRKWLLKSHLVAPGVPRGTLRCKRDALEKLPKEKRLERHRHGDGDLGPFRFAGKEMRDARESRLNDEVLGTEP